MTPFSLITFVHSSNVCLLHTRKSQKSLWKHSTEDQPPKSEDDVCPRVNSAPAEYCVEAADEQEGGHQIPHITREISIQTDLSMTDIEALQTVSAIEN
ncbi:uncharacterized protein LOC143233717 isoform X2 [Tachypleus tridentatus]